MELDSESEGALSEISSNLKEERDYTNLDSQILDLTKRGGDYLRANVLSRLNFENFGIKMKYDGAEARSFEAKLVGGKKIVYDVEHRYPDAKSMVGSGTVHNSCQNKQLVELVILDEDEEEKLCPRVIKSEMNYSDVSTPGSGGRGITSDKCVSPSMVNKQMPCSNSEVKGEEVESDVEKKSDEDEEVVVLDPLVATEIFSRKRKRGSLWQMLSWLTGIAKNPCYPEICSLTDELNKTCGNECWKQVLLAREAMFLKGRINSNAGQPVWQKDQKMLPSMYDDHSGYKEKLRCRKGKDMTSQTRASSESSSGTQIKLDKSGERENYRDKKPSGTSRVTVDSLIDKPIQKQTPLGPSFQAVVPEWTGVISESDTKWLGARVWPLEKMEYKYINERDPIGKGRQDSCGCQFRGSIECVRFHVSEKRLKLKLELGPAFRLWKFDKMGEEVRLSWTEEEEKKFKNIVKSNPPSLDKCFWNEIIRSFPTKCREDLVSYYFNVFLLRRRAYQNRATPNDINSDDDDETDSGHEKGKSPMSILYSPKKNPKVK